MSKDTADYWVKEGDLAAHGQEVGGVEFPPDYPRALECYNRAIAIDPRHGRAYLGPGKVYYRLKQYQRALDDLDHATPSPEEQVYRAQCFLELGKLDKALEVSNKLISASRAENPSYYLLQARAYAGKKDYKEASKAFRRIWELSAQFTGDSDLILACSYYEGEMYLERGDYQEACNAFDFVLSRKGDREKNIHSVPNCQHMNESAISVAFFLRQSSRSGNFVCCCKGYGGSADTR